MRTLEVEELKELERLAKSTDSLFAYIDDSTSITYYKCCWCKYELSELPEKLYAEWGIVKDTEDILSEEHESWCPILHARETLVQHGTPLYLWKISYTVYWQSSKNFPHGRQYWYYVFQCNQPSVSKHELALRHTHKTVRHLKHKRADIQNILFEKELSHKLVLLL